MKSKKKLLLLGVGAMGALALGVGATSTFAWYQVNGANIQVVDETAGLNIAKSSQQIGDFTIDVTTATLDKQPVMTDDSGNTYVVTANGDLIAAAVPAANAKIATVTLAVTVTYATPQGAADPSNEELAVLWQAALGDDDILITCAATGTESSRIKYTASATSYANVSGKNIVTIENATAAAWTFASKTTGSKSAPNMFIGFDGGSKTEGNVKNDGENNLSEITLTFTPSHA